MTKQARFSIIPGWVVTDRRLKPRDLQVLCLLGRHTNKSGWCTRSQVKMAGELDCARSTVQAAIDRLADIGVVEKHIRETLSGADSAHYYRVIFDQPPPMGYAFDAWDGEDDEDEIPIGAGDDATPPADISAPPADPASAPPAGSEPAPINVPSLTTPSERSERERARDDLDAGRRKALERRFWSLVKKWPGFDGMPKEPAKPFWFALSDTEMDKAERRFPAWLALLKKQKKDHIPAPSTYFGEKLFNAVADPQEAPAGPELVAAFGKGGMALRLWTLNQPERPHPSAPPVVQRIIDEGGPAAEAQIIARRAAYSWPRLADLDRRIAEREPIRVAAEIVSLGADFVSTDVAGPVGQAWKRFFRKCRLPWLPVEPKYAYLPVVGDGEDVDRAVAAAWWNFAERCKGYADAA